MKLVFGAKKRDVEGILDNRGSELIVFPGIGDVINKKKDEVNVFCLDITKGLEVVEKCLRKGETVKVRQHKHKVVALGNDCANVVFEFDE